MRRKQYKIRHNKQGLCIDCPQKTMPGRLRCPECLYRDSVLSKKNYQKNKAAIQKKNRERKQFLKDAGLCPDCGNEREDPDKIGCQNCRERIRYEV